MCYRKRNFRKSHQHVRNRLSFGIFQPANGKIPYEVLLYQLLLPQQMRPIQEEKSAGICGCCTHCNVLRNSKIHVNEVSYCGKPRHMHSPTLSIRSTLFPSLLEVLPFFTDISLSARVCCSNYSQYTMHSASISYFQLLISGEFLFSSLS